MASPVFILGALRSGTTVFRLMLDAHRNLANPGEVDFLFKYLAVDAAANTWTYDVQAVRKDRIIQSYGLDIPRASDGREIVRGLVKQLEQRTQFERRTKRSLTLNVHGHLDKVFALFPTAKIVHLIRDPQPRR